MGWRGMVFCALFALIVGAGLAWIIERPGSERMASVMTTGEPRVGGPFSLVDHTGRSVTESDYRGHFLLVYFGFTYCPDVCPTELQVMATALEELGRKAERVQPLFITVDPERDTTSVLADYVKHFYPRLVGLTGSVDQIAAVARAYRVYFAKEPESQAGGSSYNVNHSSYIYLMDPAGRFLDHFTFGTAPEEIARRIARYF